MLCDNQEQQGAQTHSPSDLLDEKEAARFLKMAATTLRNWRAKKEGPKYRRVGKRSIRYRVSDLEAFIAPEHSQAA